MSVVGTTGSVLPRGAAEFGHRYQSDITRIVTHILPECGNAVGELLQAVRKLTTAIPLILVGIPAANVGKGCLHPKVCFQKLSYLLETIAKL
jgi:hypothetical protein